MIYSTNDLKFKDNNLKALEEVRIFDRDGNLIKTVIAKRHSEDFINPMKEATKNKIIKKKARKLAFLKDKS